MKLRSSTKAARSRGPLQSRGGRLVVWVIGGLAAAVLIYPVAPGWKYQLENWLRGEASPIVWLRSTAGTDVTAAEPVSGHRLIIPAIGVDSEIVEGEDDSALDRGTWRIPGTSTPPEGGNTVVSGHRFRFLPPNNTTFYLLDKLRAGDRIYVWWDGERYVYEMQEAKVVYPDAVDILEPTQTERLTIFTCTPLLSTEKRLVVIAARVE